MTSLPLNWMMAPLGKVCEILDSKRVPVNQKERNARIDGKPVAALFPYYGATGQVDVIDGYLFEGEHVLLGEDGAPFLDPFRDKAYIVDGKFWVNNHAHILKAYGSNRYLSHYLNAVRYEGHVTGTTRPKLTKRALLSIPVALPPLNEQHRIVERIEALFDEIDRGVESLRTAKRTLDLYRQSLLKSAFEGRLTAEWRALNRDKLDNPDALMARIREERQACYKAALDDWEEALTKWRACGKDGKKPAKPKQQADSTAVPTDELGTLPDLPTEWRYVRLANLGDLARGKSKHRPRNDKRLLGGPYPFIQTGDVKAAGRFITEYRSTYSEFGLNQSKLWPEGTLCITIAANIAETAFLTFDACFPDSVVGFSALGELVSAKYVEFFIKSAQKRIEVFAPATAQKNINLNTLEMLVVPLCGRAEQAEIVRILDDRFETADTLDSEIDANLARAEALRQSILKKAFSGQLVPQDPADEPAHALLTRIRASRDGASTAKTRRPARRRAHAHNPP